MASNCKVTSSGAVDAGGGTPDPLQHEAGTGSVFFFCADCVSRKELDPSPSDSPL